MFPKKWTSSEMRNTYETEGATDAFHNYGDVMKLKRREKLIQTQIDYLLLSKDFDNEEDI